MTTAAEHRSRTLAELNARPLPEVLAVNVTSEDILLGKRRSAFECPLARATRRTLLLMGYGQSSVMAGAYVSGRSVVSIMADYASGIYDNGSPDFVTAFDCGANPAPCTVTLTALPA